MVGVECPYKDVCIDYPLRCRTCRHNKKRSYYEPARPDWVSIPDTVDPWSRRKWWVANEGAQDNSPIRR